VGRLAMKAANHEGSKHCSRCARFLAQRLLRSGPPQLEARRPCGRRATKRNDWRAGRAGPITPKLLSAPALGVAGDQSDDLADAEQTKRSGVRVAPASSSSRLVLAKREGSLACDLWAREEQLISRQR